jgi:hypothetical protein
MERKREPTTMTVSKRSDVARLAGSIDWVMRDQTEGMVRVDRAFFRSRDKLVLEAVSGGERYTIHLKRITDNLFEGTYDRGHRKEYDKVDCRMYSSAWHYFLFGTWIEDGSEYQWWCELKAIEQFSDELSGDKKIRSD